MATASVIVIAAVILAFVLAFISGVPTDLITAIATVVLACGTLLLAFVAIFSDTVRGWLYKPILEVSMKPEPPDCIAVPMTIGEETVADSFYLRLRVTNTGKVAARSVEVYASELQRRRADNKTWDRVDEFPTMNLHWADIHLLYWPIIVPKMGKLCDVCHIVDPARRNSDPRLRRSEQNPTLGLTDQETSLTFDLITAPNNKRHIIGPGNYQLKLLIAAENIPHPL
jgi:hypothetical protein